MRVLQAKSWNLIFYEFNASKKAMDWHWLVRMKVFLDVLTKNIKKYSWKNDRF